MVDDRDLRDARKLSKEQLGEALVDFHEKAKKAETEAERLEINAKSLRCNAQKYREEAERILKERCPDLKLSSS